MSGNLAIGVPDDPEVAQTVLARGRRLAARLGLGWIAVLIQTRRATRADDLRRLFELVLASGGQLLCAEASDVAAGLIEVSRREHAPILVIGSSRRSRLLRRITRGTAERILDAERPFDVVVAADGADV